MGERYIGYGRVSRVGDRAERLRSPDIQKRELREAASARGGTVVRIEFDLDESGGREDRPGLMRAIEAVEDGEAEGIIVAKLDRFSRDLRQALTLAERVHQAGGRIISFAENPDWTTPDGELQVGITFAFAQYTRRVLGQSFDKAKRSSVERGVPIQPRLPPGLLLVHDEHGNRIGVKHDPDVAPVIREVFERRVAGAGPAELSEFLEAKGVLTSMDSRSWSKPAVYNVLENRGYLGELRNGEHVNPEAWPPVVDVDLWNAAQRPQAKRRASRPRSASPGLVIGLVRCWSCRYAMQRTQHARGYPIYRCGGRHASGVCSAPARMRARDLEPLVVAAFWRLAEQQRARRVTDEDAETIAFLRAAYNKALAARDLYRDDPDLGETVEAMGGMAVWREGLRRHTVRVEDTERALADALAIRSVPALPELSQLRARWDDLPVQEQREALAKVIDVVGVKPHSSDLPVEQRVVVFSAGNGPTDLPRRGFRLRPALRAFDDPVAALGA